MSDFFELKKDAKKRFKKSLSYPLQPLPGVREPVSSARGGAKEVLLGQHPEAEHVVGDGPPERERLPVLVMVEKEKESEFVSLPRRNFSSSSLLAKKKRKN